MDLLHTLRYPDLADKVAVITGGSRGIGAATAMLLAMNGTRVVAVGRDESALGHVVAQVQAEGGNAIGIHADCTDPQAVAALHDQVRKEFGTVDVLAAFAGGNGWPKPSTELTLPDWRRVLDGDLTSTFLTVQEFLPEMLSGGGGTIITMSSAAGRVPSQTNLAYAVAKAGVVMLTRHLAAELGGTGVRINCLAPSAVRNDKMSAALSPEEIVALGLSFPLGRIGEPADVAAAAAFLASDASSWITGVTLDVAGGKIIL